MELDKFQQTIVDSNESTVVVAPPGGGKTRVLTEKARRLLEEGKDILCLCFTRAAAREMASRVPGLPAATIHSYCCSVVGWDDDWGYTGLLHRFLWEKDRRRFDWVLLDEAQDVNELELDVVMSLMGNKIFAVGDPYQSIYGFQGAMGFEVVNVLEGMGAVVKELHNNYRSCKNIIDRLEKIYKRKLVSSSVKENGLTFVLTRTNDDLFYVSGELKRLGVPHKMRISVDAMEKPKREWNVLGESNIRLSTIHCAKGLEASHVVLFGWTPQGRGEEKRVYYVAVSRSSKTFDETDYIEELVGLVSRYGKIDESI